MITVQSDGRLMTRRPGWANIKTTCVLRMLAQKPLFILGSFFVRSLDSTERYIFDFLLGVSTRESAYTDSTDGDNFKYESCQWLPVRRALKDLDPGASDVFVDLGSGKGKALIIGAFLPYQRIIGLEIDKELSRLSLRNIEKVRPRLRTQRVYIVTDNVLEWSIPDDASVVFMFNPFAGQTFRTAMARIFESYDRSPRNLHIVYQYPWEHDWLMSTGRVIVENVMPCQWPTHPWWSRVGKVIVSYRVVRQGVPSGSPTRLPRRLFRSRRETDRWTTPNDLRSARITTMPGAEI